MHTESIGGGAFEHWSPEEVRDALTRHEIVLIDVRTAQEFAFERVAGALLSPMAELDPANLPTQDGKRLVLHCGSGMRSRKVAEACLAAGITRIAHLDGGFAAWKAAGMAYLATDPTTGGVRKVPAAG
ncbi:MAG: rhodanese-like domain-containing protein [Rhodobacteraceae bacterium]|nr:MAG: rhodanese-like domain-containing protein [Paracoccaceae bacterium]